MKKTKFRKLSRVLISISLLAIIAVSLISVPVSADEGDSVVGTWVFNKTFSQSVLDTTEFTFYDINGRFYCYGLTDRLVDKTYIAEYSNLSFQGRIGEDGEGWWYRYYGQLNGLSGSANQLVVTPRWDGSSVEICSASKCINLTAEDGDVFNNIYVVEIFEDPNQEGFLDFLTTFATRYVEPVSLLENILGTFSEVGSWIGTIVSSLVALFWSVETASLTFLGILSVAGLAFSVIMLLFGFVTRFVGFSG